MFEEYRRVVMAARLMGVEGVVEKSPEGVVHLMAHRVFDRSAELDRLSDANRTEITLSRADEIVRPQYPRGPVHTHPRNARILPGSRDFH